MSGPNTVPVAICHRASTLDQDPTLARDELRAAAQMRGMKAMIEVEESGSGARNDRPGLQQVLDAARRGRVKAVLVHKLDRWGRSALDVLHNIRVLEEAGVEFVVTSQGLHIKPHGDAVSKLILGVLASVAEFERSLIVERTKLGLDKARRSGKRLGRPRKGNAPASATVIEMRAAGQSWSTIADTLGCTIAAVRRACQNGTTNQALASVESHEAA